nr:hypothetical protein HK105_000846 [Polyrhizophydium stewartii]
MAQPGLVAVVAEATHGAAGATADSASPFALDPNVLLELVDPKNPDLLARLNGVEGLASMLKTDTKRGLAVPTTQTEGKHIKGGNSIRGKLMGMSVLGVNTQNSSESDLVARRRVFGSNALPEPIEKSILQLMWEALQDRTLLVLIGAAIVEMAIGVYESRFAPEGKRDSLALVDGVAIIVAIFIVALVGSISDLQKQSQFRTLNEFGKRLSEVKVIRNGVTQAISSASIVVGDVCLIQTGDVVPADGVLIHGFNVEADESTLTGEPFAVEKDLVRDPFLLSGTNVINGVGRILVIATGVNSLNGRSLLALEVEPEETPLQEKLGRIADFIAKFAIVAAIVATVILVIAYFAINSGSLKTPYAVTEDILSLFILAVTVVVVAVPEGLPLAVTLSLAHATLQMLKDNNLVRHLSSCETMGNATTICSDKTGTLTMNKMTVVKGLIMDTPIDAKTTQAELLSRLGGNGPAGNTLVGKVLSLVMLSVNTNSSADETADKTGKIVFMGSKTEIAILNLTARLGYPYKLDRERVSILQVEPFSSDRKRMSTLASARREAALEGVFTQKDVESVETEHEKWVFVKGASEIVLASCTHYISAHGTVEALAPTKRAHFERIIAEFASGALRTICAAVRHVPSSSEASATGPLEPHHHLDDDKDLVLVAIFGILDPVRPEVPEAVQACQKAGIVVRMVTGDNVATARAIAAECGILSSDGLVMEGPAFRALSEEQMDVVLPRLQVLARSSPLDKQVLVSNLKRLGETVAVTGDGTNDAPALTAADVGFSMGVAGTEVAKEASDIVLMDDNFASLVKAVLWGRCVYDSIRKFLQFQLTVNASAVFITFISAFVTTVGPKHSPYPALSAVQLLWINLIMDTLAALALATDPPSPELLDRKPASRTESILSRDMVMQILGQGIFQIVAIMVIYCNGFAWWATSLPPEEQSSEAGVDSVTATIIFNTFVFCQVFNEINSRSITKDIDVFKNFSKNRMFIGVLVSTVLSQIIIVHILVGALSLPIGCLIRLMPEFELPWWLERWQGFERLSNTGSEHLRVVKVFRAPLTDQSHTIGAKARERRSGSVNVSALINAEAGETAAAETGEGRHMWQTLRSVMNASHAFTSGVRLSRVDYATLQMVDPTRSKFAPYGVSCQEMTGDTDYNRMAEIQRSNIIVTTPEKWDATTRKWRDQKNLLRLLRLVLLDEVHMLKEPGRGATLEAVVSRMKAVSRELCLASEQRSIRFLAISATMPNIADVAEWLRDNRDVPAELRLYEDFQLLARGGSHPFEWCRRQLAADAMPVFSDKKLAQFVAQGVAFHHGAHLVIIKGTSQYVNGEFRSYSDMDIEQMLGRAAHSTNFQFDDTGVSVIMTTAERREYYLDVVSGRETIESSLHQNLIEHLNAEVVLGSIENKATALEWLNSTFLYVRIRKNPAYYKLKDCSKEASKLSAEHRLEVFGSAMAKYYLMFKTVLAVVKLKSRPSLPEVAEEFERIRFHSDKAHLNALNKNQDIRFPIKGRVVTISQKVNVLLQLARALANSGILSFDDLIKAGPQRVEMLANRHPPFGTKLVTAAQSQPRLVMNVSQIQTVGSVAASRDALTLDLSVSVGVSNPLSGQFLDFRRLP